MRPPRDQADFIIPFLPSTTGTISPVAVLFYYQRRDLQQASTLIALGGGIGLPTHPRIRGRESLGWSCGEGILNALSHEFSQI